MQQFGDDARPTGLMRRAKSASIVAVEEFVEQDVIAEVRIARELGVRFHRGALAVFAFEKEFGKAMGDFIRRIIQRGKLS